MSQHTQLEAADGHKLDAYIAEPADKPKAGIVVVQEIFGVNAHIRSVVDKFAAAGYLTIAPALFDRVERHVELDYNPDTMKQGYAFMQQIPPDQAIADIDAAIGYLRRHGARKVGVVGFCWGGTMAWLSNTRLHPDATVSYYPGGVQNYAAEKATAPAIFHFGLRDSHIPQSAVELVRQQHPESAVYTYDADHAFNREGYPPYVENAAKLAMQRTVAHFDHYLTH